MGIFINKGNTGFQSTRNSEYVDKSAMISVVNKTLFTEQRFTCVTRCRRFGKSMAAKMLAAYYDRSCDSRSLFSDLIIADDPSFEKHLNKYPVIYLDMTLFVTQYHDKAIVFHIDDALKEDIQRAFPHVEYSKNGDLLDSLLRITGSEDQKFIFIIDEWDAICRELDPEAVDAYVNWLRRMFKSVLAVDVFAGVYMTGILPIKKYNTQSALNNFKEYSMVSPGRLAGCFGFTTNEVKALSEKYGMDFDELEKWYDGYQIGMESGIFNPNSVMQALDNGYCDSYWAATGAFDTVSNYIRMDFEGLKNDIIKMLAGGRCKVNPTKFQNDLSVVNSKDDVLTVLIHLGYLSFDWQQKECYIPNREVAGEMTNAIEANHWKPVVDAIDASERLIQDTLNGDEEAVARAIGLSHDESTSILSYNDENSLACVLSIAYYAARNNYIIHRELASGKGFADLVLIPRKNVESPAIIIELKCDRNAEAAIDQIKRKEYPSKVAQYAHDLLLVGINYDRKTKQHECKIERI